MNEHRDAVFAELQEKGIPEEVFEASVNYGREVASKVLAYAKKDNYHESRSFPKYSVVNQPGTWQPTPPAYMEPLNRIGIRFEPLYWILRPSLKLHLPRLTLLILPRSFTSWPRKSTMQSKTRPPKKRQ